MPLRLCPSTPPSRRISGPGVCLVGDPLVWSPQLGFPQSQDPAPSFTISHRGQVTTRSLLRWAKSSKLLCVEVCIPPLTPELWHPGYVVRTRKGAHERGPLACAHVLLLADSPLSSLSCFFSSCPLAASSVQIIGSSLSQLKNPKKQPWGCLTFCLLSPALPC